LQAAAEVIKPSTRTDLQREATKVYFRFLILRSRPLQVLVGILCVRNEKRVRNRVETAKKYKKGVFMAAAPPPTVVGRRASASDRCSSQSEKMKIERREKRASLSREKIERERKVTNESNLSHNPYILDRPSC